MDMEDQYGIGDLRQFMNGRSIFTAIPPPPPPLPPPPPDLFLSSSSHHHHHHHHMNQQQSHYHDMVMGSGLMFRGDSSSNNSAAAAAVAAAGGGSNSASASLEMEVGGGGGGGGGGGIGGGGDGGGNGRWPRQETLTLLEVRSRLDSKFKEANQKGPLWDEVSRIMCEEHGYQRSGKKCREKFENLYKYYKKTKEGKAGRQDGKHYRFFRQLEALYGETSNNPTASLLSENAHLVGTNFQSPYHPYQEAYNQAPSRLCDSLSLSNNSSGFDTSSSEYSNLNVATASLMEPNDTYEKMKKRKGKRNWKAKVKEFIDSQMRKLMEKQEEWMEKMMNTIEHKEQERTSREEEWRKQEVARVDREQKFWGNERAWIEARDAAFMEALNKISGKELIKVSNMSPQCENQSEENFLSSWQETEITRLIQLRTSMEIKFEQSGGLDEVLWEEIAEKMARLGYHKNGLMCKAKWDSINDYLMKSKKPKENSRSSLYSNQNNEPIITNQGVTYRETIERVAPNDHQHEASPANALPDNCFRFFMGDAENLWESYGVKLTKGENQ